MSAKMPKKAEIRDIEKLGNDLQEIQRKLDEQLEIKAAHIKTLLIKLTPLVRFLDKEIIIGYFFTSTTGEVINTYEEKGLLILKDIINNTEIEMVEEKDPFSEKIIKWPHTFIKATGTEVYLSRSGKIVQFTVYRYDPDNHKGGPEEIKLTEPKLIEATDLLKIDPYFEEQIIKNLKTAIREAVKDNENKRFILKNLIEYIQKIAPEE